MMELKQGNILKGGKYKIVKTLGQGSFGITYLATTRISMDGQLGKLDVNVNVTIKEFFMSDFNSRLSDGTSVDKTNSTIVHNYQNKFRKEAENLAKLYHTNIVKVLEVFDENNTTYYVMEFIDGETVDDYIKRKGRLSEGEALKIIKEVCSALSYIHEHKMLHLDVKPKNMMRNCEGQIYLIDFGLAKQYDDKGEPESSTSIGLGTVGYAPIEQAHFKRDGSLPVTLDIYAVGASMYKMLTGKTPPESSYVLNEGLPLSPLKDEGVSEHTINVVKKAMAPIKKERYQSVKDLMLAISNNSVDSEETIVNEVENTHDEQTVYGAEQKEIDSGEDLSDDGGIYVDMDDEPSFLEKYWKYGLIVVAILAGVYCCSNWNSSQETPVDELLSDTMMVDTLFDSEEHDLSMTKSNPSKKEIQPSEETVDDELTPVETPVNISSKENNSLTKSEVNSKNVYDLVEQMPSFPGGNDALMMFLQENVKYPVVAQENDIQGRVIVSFVVEKDGSITNVKVVSSVDPSLDKEAVRVVKAMPHWNPGKLDGVPVRVKYNVPISFRLQ